MWLGSAWNDPNNAFYYQRPYLRFPQIASLRGIQTDIVFGTSASVSTLVSTYQIIIFELQGFYHDELLSTLTAKTISSLINFVKLGGGLIICNEEGGGSWIGNDVYARINQLANSFGLNFNTDFLWGGTSSGIITINTVHKITQNVPTLYVEGICTINSTRKKAVEIYVTKDNVRASPIAVSSLGKGRVVAVGDGNLLPGTPSYYTRPLEESNNLNVFINNVIDWLLYKSLRGK